MTKLINADDIDLDPSAVEKGVEVAVTRWLSENPDAINTAIRAGVTEWLTDNTDHDTIRVAILDWLDYTPNHGLR